MEASKEFKGPVLSEASLEYFQDSDDCDDGLGQNLCINTDDGGGGPYYVLKSDRWAFCSIAEITRELLDFAARAGMDVKAEKTKLAELLCAEDAPIEREKNEE
jgi:hypothetical protein